MQTQSKYVSGLLALIVLATQLRAQVPAVPGAAAAPAATAAPAAAPAAVGDAGKGFAFIRKCQEQKELCKRKLCETVFGQFLNNMTKPMTLMTGGLIPPCCPETPSAEELAAAADDAGPLGAAAQIAADEAKAKKRRAAVRYLGTVDCHWWPEAEAALIIAIRTDRNECVRLEAAKSLGNGCCCTRKVIEALAICVEGSSRDGNPSENSDRVRFLALAALHHCLECYVKIVPVDPTNSGKESAKPLARITPQPLPAAVHNSLGFGKLPPYYAQVERTPLAEVVNRARQVAQTATAKEHQSAGPSDQSFYDVFFTRATSPEPSATAVSTAAGSESFTIVASSPDSFTIVPSAGSEPKPGLGVTLTSFFTPFSKKATTEPKTEVYEVVPGQR